MVTSLLRPFSYLSIEHKLKWKVDWLYPFIFAILSTALVFVLQRFGQVSLYASDGIVAKILSFVQGLPGFYIAALAVIATFNRTDIDKIMPAPAPKIDIVVRGESVAIELTRRRFLCSMFSFLTAESLILVILAVFAQSFYISFKAILNGLLQYLASGLFVLIFFLFFWQMIITSFWGLFYLGDKLHQPNP